MTSHPRSLFSKIWDAHFVCARPDGRDIIYMDRHMIHEVHAPRGFETLARDGRAVRRPDLSFAVQDHTVASRLDRTETTNPEGTPFIRAMRAGTVEHGIRLFDIDDPDQGIVHVIAPELGIVLPGATHAVPDSHASTVGGIGAISIGCGTTEMEHILATQTMAISRPKEMRIRLTGELAPHVTAKDVSLHIIGVLGVAGGRGFAIEYAGPVVEAMSIESRLTLCNLSIEGGARTSLVAPDARTIEWIRGRPWAPTGDAWDRAVAYWQGLPSDAGAVFDADLEIDCSALQPQVTWGTDPSQVMGIDDAVPRVEDLPEARRGGYEKALDYMGLRPGERLAGKPVDRVFIGSCTNGRLQDIQAAARVAQGRHVAPGVTALIVPGSTRVRRQAEEMGLAQILTDAGFIWGASGCSMCGGGNGDRGKPQERCVSTTNRNFEGRQGSGVRTHLVSPATAAASAIAGRIADVRDMQGTA